MPYGIRIKGVVKKGFPVTENPFLAYDKIKK